MSRPDADDVVAAYLRELAADTRVTAPLPDPQRILQRARLRERLEAEQRAADRVARPMLAAGLIGPFAAGVVLATRAGATELTVLAAAVLLTALAAGLGVRLALIED
jgi:hypothetical protein